MKVALMSFRVIFYCLLNCGSRQKISSDKKWGSKAWKALYFKKWGLKPRSLTEVYACVELVFV